jgi:hypothetical protein
MAKPRRYSGRTYGCKMKYVPVFFPQVIIEALDLMVEKGIFPDRSSAVRSIITQSIPDVLTKYDLIGELVADGNRAPPPPAMNNVLTVKMSKVQDKIVEEMASVLGVTGKATVVRMALDYFYRYHYLPYFKPLAESMRGRKV